MSGRVIYLLFIFSLVEYVWAIFVQSLFDAFVTFFLSVKLPREVFGIRNNLRKSVLFFVLFFSSLRCLYIVGGGRSSDRPKCVISFARYLEVSWFHVVFQVALSGFRNDTKRGLYRSWGLHLSVQLRVLRLYRGCTSALNRGSTQPLLETRLGSKKGRVYTSVLTVVLPTQPMTLGVAG